MHLPCSYWESILRGVCFTAGANGFFLPCFTDSFRWKFLVVSCCLTVVLVLVQFIHPILIQGFLAGSNHTISLSLSCDCCFDSPSTGMLGAIAGITGESLPAWSYLCIHPEFCIFHTIMVTHQKSVKFILSVKCTCKLWIQTWLIPGLVSCLIHMVLHM